MQNLKKYKTLIRSTITYLENFEDDFIESKSSYFKKFIKKKDKLINEEVLLKKNNPKITLSQQPAAKKLTQNKEIKKNNILENIENTLLETTKQKESPIKTNASITSSNILENKKIKVEKKPAIIEDDFNDIKSVLSKMSTNLAVNEDTLDDKIAKQKSQKYKLKNIAANLTILAYKENEKLYKFLEKLSIALNNYFHPSKVVSAYIVEKENNWDVFLSENEIFLIISSDYTIFELPYLRNHYRENPSTKEKFLDNIPLFLLPDISIYLKEPTLKASLFKALKQKIVKLNK